MDSSKFVRRGTGPLLIASVWVVFCSIGLHFLLSPELVNDIISKKLVFFPSASSSQSLPQYDIELHHSYGRLLSDPGSTPFETPVKTGGRFLLKGGSKPPPFEWEVWIQGVVHERVPEDDGWHAIKHRLVNVTASTLTSMGYDGLSFRRRFMSITKPKAGRGINLEASLLGCVGSERGGSDGDDATGNNGDSENDESDDVDDDEGRKNGNGSSSGGSAVPYDRTTNNIKAFKANKAKQKSVKRKGCRVPKQSIPFVLSHPSMFSTRGNDGGDDDGGGVNSVAGRDDDDSRVDVQGSTDENGRFEGVFRFNSSSVRPGHVLRVRVITPTSSASSLLSSSSPSTPSSDVDDGSSSTTIASSSSVPIIASNTTTTNKDALLQESSSSIAGRKPSRVIDVPLYGYRGPSVVTTVEVSSQHITMMLVMIMMMWRIDFHEYRISTRSDANGSVSTYDLSSV